MFRIIPEKIVPLEELALPPAIATLAHLDQGLVLVTGPDRLGQVDHARGDHRPDQRAATRKHIVTIEDPVEFVHQNKKCGVLAPRGRRRTPQGFAAGAARRASARTPTSILVGEMRDYETISLALTAAEMGVLVFGTLHTNSAAKTIDRIIDAFPADEQAQVRLIARPSRWRASSSQLLLPTADGKGRVRRERDPAAHQRRCRT